MHIPTNALGALTPTPNLTHSRTQQKNEQKKDMRQWSGVPRLVDAHDGGHHRVRVRERARDQLHATQPPTEYTVHSCILVQLREQYIFVN